MGRPPCCERGHTKKGIWSREEDERLINHINTHGVGHSWSSLPQRAGLNRCGKSCRLRWINYLKPDVKRGNFNATENDTIIKLHAQFGNKWSLIAGKLDGRTDNEIKNHWNTNLKRMLLAKGIDPKTHKPHNNGLFVMSTNKNKTDKEKQNNKSGAYDENMKIIGTGTSSAGENSNSISIVSDKVIATQIVHQVSTELKLDLSLGLPSPRPKACPMNPMEWLKLERQGQKGNF